MPATHFFQCARSPDAGHTSNYPVLCYSEKSLDTFYTCKTLPGSGQPANYTCKIHAGAGHPHIEQCKTCLAAARIRFTRAKCYLAAARSLFTRVKWHLALASLVLHRVISSWLQPAWYCTSRFV